MPGTTRRSPKAAPKKKAAPQANAATSPSASDSRPLDQWLSELSTTPHTVTVFGREWQFKQPTGGRAQRYYDLSRTPGQGIAAALASVAYDETPAPDLEIPDPDVEGATKKVPQAPGSALAEEFLMVAEENVPSSAVVEFWRRFQAELFDVGEA